MCVQSLERIEQISFMNRNRKSCFVFSSSSSFPSVRFFWHTEFNRKSPENIEWTKINNSRKKSKKKNEKNGHFPKAPEAVIGETHCDDPPVRSQPIHFWAMCVVRRRSMLLLLMDESFTLLTSRLMTERMSIVHQFRITCNYVVRRRKQIMYSPAVTWLPSTRSAVGARTHLTFSSFGRLVNALNIISIFLLISNFRCLFG